MADELLGHVAKVRRLLSSLSSEQCFAFAAACAERQWPVYLRASEAEPWAAADALRSALDAVWDGLLGGPVPSKSLALKIEHIVQELAVEHPPGSHAFHVANSVFGLISIVSSGRGDFAYQMAQQNLDLIDAFLHQRLQLQVGQNDTLVDQHPLSELERSRQLADLVKLAQPLDVALLTGLRTTSVGKSILGAS